MALETLPFDTAKYLTDPEDQAELLVEAIATGDQQVIKHALNIVARARGMTRVSRDAGVSREALYKALGPDGDPRLSTFLGVVNALGVKLSATVIENG